MSKVCEIAGPNLWTELPCAQTKGCNISSFMFQVKPHTRNQNCKVYKMMCKHVSPALVTAYDNASIYNEVTCKHQRKKKGELFSCKRLLRSLLIAPKDPLWYEYALEESISLHESSSGFCWWFIILGAVRSVLISWCSTRFVSFPHSRI